MKKSKEQLIFLSEPKNEKSQCVLSLIPYCCKINGFDKTSQKPFIVLTSGNAQIIGSCDNCFCQHIVAERGMEFSRKKKENVFLRKLKTKVSGKQKNSRGLLCCISLRSLSVCWAGKVGFPHLG